jgi:hypothetical protein
MELKIMFQFVRLVAAILLEGLASAGHVILFLLRRRDQRGKIHALILGRPCRRQELPAAAIFAFLLLAALTLVVVSGCSSTKPRHGSAHVRTATSSLENQVEELEESVEFLFSMQGARSSLETDLGTLAEDADFEQLGSSLEFFLWSPDARRSLEDDLGEFGDGEPGALQETFELWGW